MENTLGIQTLFDLTLLETPADKHRLLSAKLKQDIAAKKKLHENKVKENAGRMRDAHV